MTTTTENAEFASLFEDFKAQISNHDVVLYMKGTAEFPQCGFSAMTAQVLDYVGVDYLDVNVLGETDLRPALKAFSNWPTFPQIYVKGEFIGGADILREMFESGEFTELLAEKGVPCRKG